MSSDCARRRFEGTVQALAVVLATACYEAPETRLRLEAVDRCEVGITKAIRSRTRDDSLRSFSAECAPLYGEPPCREALSKVSPDTDNPFMVPLLFCLKQYCPKLPGGRVAACNGGDIIGQDAVNRAWLDLSGAIFEHEGSGDDVRLGLAFLRFFTDLNTRKPRRWPVDEAKAATAADGCERGIEHAMTLGTRREVLRAFYEECASVYIEHGCREAFLAAANAEPTQQPLIVTLGCREAYCRWLPGTNIEACDGEFVPTAAAVERAWPPLDTAILNLDAKKHVPRLMEAMLRLHAVLPSRPPG
jgi:hypothetical protein